jgi:hypothetical protein
MPTRALALGACQGTLRGTQWQRPLESASRPASHAAAHARLESLTWSGSGSSLSPGVSAVPLAWLVGLWHRRDGRHGLPWDGCGGVDVRLRYPKLVSVDSTAPFAETAPRSSRVEYAFPKADGGELKVVWRDGGLLPAHPPMVPADAKWPLWNDGGQLWIGDSGMIVANIYGNEPRLLDARKDAEVRATPLAVKYPRTRGVYAEFVAAAKAGTQPGSNFAGHAGPLAEIIALGNLAVRAGRAIELDVRDGTVKTAGTPGEWMVPVYRAGWQS